MSTPRPEGLRPFCPDPERYARMMQRIERLHREAVARREAAAMRRPNVGTPSLFDTPGSHLRGAI